MKLHCLLLTPSLLLGAASAVTAQTVLMQEDFAGSGATLLNATTADVGGAWVANSFINANGSFNLANEGSALLDFTPEVNKVYTLSMDILNTTSSWVGLGFKGATIGTAGGSNQADRFAFTNNSNYGVAWFLYRNNGAASAIQAFGGYHTSLPLTTIASAVTGNNYTISHNMKIVVDTTGTGTNFKVSMFIDSTPLVAETTVALPISALNFAGFTYDNTGTGTIQVDNFLLTAAIPEPSSFAAFAGIAALGLSMARRRRQGA